MSRSARAPLRSLGPVEAIPDGGARGFEPAHGAFTGLFAVRQGIAVAVYVNSCPHIGTPLNWAPDRFLAADGSRIVCATHGAQFEPMTGLCVHGPCMGERLESVAVEIRDGVIYVSAEAGL